MKITADTNVLVRALTEDHAAQSKAAQAALQRAEVVAISISALCELVWVLSQGYKIRSVDITEAVRGLLSSANVVVNRPAAEAGLAVLDAGGDFADGAASAAKFTGRRVHRVIPRAGHNLPQEEPEAFAAAVMEVSRGDAH